MTAGPGSLFQENPVDAVVLDYAMPGMHGGEVAARMRAAKPDVPILCSPRTSGFRRMLPG